MKNRDRLYLNVVKGIAVILMIWGHCIQYCAQGSFDFFENGIFKFIYSFHMPLFMLISGYLFSFSAEKRDLKSLLIHRTQGMLQPIVFAGVLNALLLKLPILLRTGSFRVLDGELFNEFQSFWFLWCVLSASLAVGIACKVTDRLWLQLILSGLGVVLVAMFPNIHMHLFMYPYFVIGFFYARLQGCLPENFGKLRYVSLVVFPAMLPFYETRHYIYVSPVFSSEMGLMNSITISGFRWAIGLAGCVFVLTVIRLLFDLTVQESRTPAIWQGVARLGENSLAIYCLSVSLLSGYLPQIYAAVVHGLGGNLPAENWFVYNLLLTPLLSLGYCFGLYALVQLLKKWNLHEVIFGR